MSAAQAESERDQVDASGTVAQQIIPQYQLKGQLQKPMSPPQLDTQWQRKLDDGRFVCRGCNVFCPVTREKIGVYLTEIHWIGWPQAQYGNMFIRI